MGPKTELQVLTNSYKKGQSGLSGEYLKISLFASVINKANHDTIVIVGNMILTLMEHHAGVIFPRHG